MSHELLAHAKDVLSIPRQPAHVLRYTCARLTESLGDVLRVAEERGLRLGGDGAGAGAPVVFWGNPARLDGGGGAGRGFGPA
ncbi:hypothetical protein [Streptomyces sp. NPDC057702]|uniref:hypothetical protein n=1 Tax=unclassified Streptomyces TaxID=2593676 RepID=UPI0036A6BD8E